MTTRHTPETKAQAILRPGTTRDVGAALSVPKESVRNWRAAYRANPDALGPDVRRLVEAAAVVNEGAMVSRLWDSFVAGIDAAQRGIDRARVMLEDPKLTPEQASRLIDSMTSGSERLAKQWQLLTDRPTERTETNATGDPWARQAEIEAMQEMLGLILEASDDELDGFIARADPIRQIARAAEARDVTPEAVPHG